MAKKQKRRQDSDPVDDNNSKRGKIRQAPPLPPVEAEPPVEREATANAKKNRNNKNKHGGGDGPQREKGRTGLITDERFVSAHSDPRFQRMPERQSKVTIDSRFSRILSDEDFLGSTAPVDKRGRPREGIKTVNPLRNHYFEEEEEEEEDEKAEPSRKDEDDEDAGADADESDEEEDEMLSGPGSDTDDDSSSDEDLNIADDQNTSFDKVTNILLARDEDIPEIEQETHRLAIVNMDWDHIKAVDLYVVMNSYLPKGGQILSVAIYPSEFGLERMQVEAVRGPSALFDASDEDKEDDSGTDDEKLRHYELDKLRYYYAVVVCDSSITANHIYKTLDGTELLSTSNVFDLRFIPDSMEFKHPPRDFTKEAPASYQEPDFFTRALQHSTVKLTWDEDEPHRRKILRRKFNSEQLDGNNEFDEYIASTSDSDDDEDEHNRESKKEDAREKYLSLLQPEDDSDTAYNDDKDMEITFNPSLEDMSKRILEKKDKKSDTLWEAVLRKKKEKKKARKKSKYSSDDDSSDFDVQEAPEEPDQPDDFFVEEPVGAKTSNIKGKDKSKKRGKSSHNGGEHSSKINNEQEATTAELELLLADEQDGDHGPKGYNMKHKKVKGKKGKEMSAEDKLPDVDYKKDSRFSALLTSPLFVLDPTDPQFKRSAAYVRQRSQKHETSAMDKRREEEAMNRSEMQSVDVVPDTNDNLHPVGVPSSEKEKHDFSSTVRSLKRNLVTMKKETKKR